MGYVRALVPEDISQVTELYATVFSPPVAGSLDGLQSALHEMFFCHPWLDDRLPSLVYQEKNRRIVGCLGVMPRPMSLDGRPIQAAITHTFMVDPRSRTTLAGVELIRTLLSGWQDVTLAQGTSLSRRIFEAVGGSTSLLQSLGWTRVLRPSRYTLSFLKRRGLPAAFSAALAPFCSAADAITGRILPPPLRLSASGLSGEELDPEMLGKCLSEFSRDRALRPKYDVASLKWLLGLLARQNGDVAFKKILVRDSSQETVGCYLYYRHAAGVADVVQIAARPKAINEVLEHLFYDAYRHGLMAVSGQLDARFLPALGAKYCLFNRGDGSWLLAHSKRPDLLAAVHRGDAFLTRLEAEWWIGFVLVRSLAIAGEEPQGRVAIRAQASRLVRTRPPEGCLEDFNAVHRP